jgi:transcriptional regulator with XRE-family HTH domain
MPRKPIVRGNLPTYAVNIRKLLRDREMSHAQFADKVKLSKQSMYSALNGGDIRVSTLFRMARELKLEPYVLLMPEPVAHPVEVQAPPQVNPLLTLLAGLAQPQQPQAALPVAAQEFLSYWAQLDSRGISALINLAKSLAANPTVDVAARTASLINAPTQGGAHHTDTRHRTRERHRMDGQAEGA